MAIVAHTYCSRYARRYRTMAFLIVGHLLDHLCYFVCDRVIDEHRTKKIRIMNIQVVPSTPDNHPAMSLI